LRNLEGVNDVRLRIRAFSELSVMFAGCEAGGFKEL